MTLCGTVPVSTLVPVTNQIHHTKEISLNEIEVSDSDDDIHHDAKSDVSLDSSPKSAPKPKKKHHKHKHSPKTKN